MSGALEWLALPPATRPAALRAAHAAGMAGRPEPIGLEATDPRRAAWADGAAGAGPWGPALEALYGLCEAARERALDPARAGWHDPIDDELVRLGASLAVPRLELTREARRAARAARAVRS